MDRAALETFACVVYRQPWTQEIEHLVREELSPWLDAGHGEAAGAFENGVLVAVASWTPIIEEPPTWRSGLIAVRTGSARRGHGLGMKMHVLERARAAGAAAVTSTLHRDNHAMWRINERLGATFTPTDALQEYFTAAIWL